MPAGRRHSSASAATRARGQSATSKSARTRAEILEAAVECLGVHGYHGVTLGRIAAAAGVTRGAVQYYFMHTEDVMLALTGQVKMQVSSAFDPISAVAQALATGALDRDAVARLELVVAARTSPGLRAVLDSHGSPLWPARPRVRVAAVMRRL